MSVMKRLYGMPAARRRAICFEPEQTTADGERCDCGAVKRVTEAEKAAGEFKCPQCGRWLKWVAPF